jgi:hypothetical protein
MRIALWTPRKGAGWLGALAPHLAREVGLVLVDADLSVPPVADVHVYHVADDPAHGYVFRALRREPGIVVLEDWNTHRLVHAETVGRGDAMAYRREARRAQGETGSFIAEQVLAGQGGALPAVLPLNDRILEASLALATTREEIQCRASARLHDRPVVLLPVGDPVAAAHALAALARTVQRDHEALHAAVLADRGPEGTLGALALDELRPSAHSLGLSGIPADAVTLVAGLFAGRR